MLGAKGSARLEQRGGPIPVLFLDVGAAKQPRGFGVRSVGKEVREQLPGFDGLAGSRATNGPGATGAVAPDWERRPRPRDRARRTGGAPRATLRDRSSLARAVPRIRETTSFPPWLSYQSLARFLGREFPVILEVKLTSALSVSG